MIVSDVADNRGDIMRRLQDLERQIREMRAERRLAASTISAGSLRVVDANGTVIALLGDLSSLLGPDQKGFWLGRPGPTESTAITVFGTGEGGDGGFIGIYDRSGTYVITDDAASGRGLGRPYLSLPIADLSAPTATTTNSSFVNLAAGITALHHPVLYGYVLVRSDDGSTTGEVRLTLNGTAIGPTITVSGSEFTIKFIGPFVVPSPPAYEQINTIAAQARRTAGTGSIGIRVLSILGLESAYAP